MAEEAGTSSSSGGGGDENSTWTKAESTFNKYVLSFLFHSIPPPTPLPIIYLTTPVNPPSP